MFLINDTVYKDTKNDPYGLYKLLEKIYFMEEENINLGKKVLERLIFPIDKDNVNRIIKNIHMNNINYINFNYTHVLNDFFTDESTKLSIYNTYLKVKSNATFPIFFKDIKNLKNVFICDFINLDYFYLKETITSSCAL